MKKVFLAIILAVISVSLGAQSILYDEKNLNPGSKAEMPDTPYQDIYTLLSTIPGVEVIGTQVSIRGSDPELGEEPLVLFDGVETSLEDINVFDVASVDVLKGPETAIYGINGQYGVISIRSKAEKMMKENAEKAKKGKKDNR